MFGVRRFSFNRLPLPLRSDHRLGLVRRIVTMPDPARPNDPDLSSPFFPERRDQPILETVEIATEGEDCDECVRRLSKPLRAINGVCEVKVHPEQERVIVTFDSRKTHVPDLHDAILKSGYKPAPVAE